MRSWWRLAIGAERREHRRAGEDPARVVRVQAHQLPLLGPQRPRPLPDAGRDGDPAEVVHQPGAVDEPGVGRRRAAGGRRAREPGDAARVAVEPRASSGRRRRRTRPAPRRAPRRRGTCAAAPARRRRPRPRGRRGSTSAQQLAGRVEEDRGDRRVERAAGPARDRLGRDGGAADGVEHDGREADRGEPRRLGDLLAGLPVGRAAAVEALEAVEHGAADGVGQPQAPASGRRRPRSRRARPPRRTSRHHRPAQRSAASAALAEAGEEPQRLGRPRGVDQVAARADQDVVAAERGGDLVRRRGAAGEAQQRRVVDVAPAGRRRARRAGRARSPAGTRASPRPADGRA